MNTVEELFQNQADLSGCAPALLHSVVDRLTVEEETRGVEVSLRCGELLTAGALQQGEESLRKSSLNLGRVRLLPHYAPELFSGAHVPELLQQLKRQDATLNGTFCGCLTEYAEGTLTVTLRHGGLGLLKARHTGQKLSDMIAEQFSGLKVQVQFDGRVQVDENDAVQIEKQQKEEETKRREAAVQMVEGQDRVLHERKPQTISVREGATLRPTLLTETARDIMGRTGKIRLTPIEDVTPETGSCMIWGEIFMIESRETRDGSRKI